MPLYRITLLDESPFKEVNWDTLVTSWQSFGLDVWLFTPMIQQTSAEVVSFGCSICFLSILLTGHLRFEPIPYHRVPELCDQSMSPDDQPLFIPHAGI